MRLQHITDLLEKTRQAILAEEAKITSDLNHANERVTTLVRYKTKGFMDGTVDILKKHGMGAEQAYAVADEIWDTIKLNLSGEV